jgi:hypothetical protein
MRPATDAAAVNDLGLYHLINQNQSSLTELTLMSCQGITSSAITKAGLLQAIAMTGCTLKKLTVMCVRSRTC